MSYTPEQMMLMIKGLAPNATIAFSEYTHQWYVEASIEIGNGVLLTGGAEHRDSPAEAVRGYFQRLTSIGLDEYIVSKYSGQRREWRWNGAAFVEQTRPETLHRSANGLAHGERS